MSSLIFRSLSLHKMCYYDPKVEELQNLAQSESILPKELSRVYVDANNDGFEIWIGSTENARNLDKSFNAVLNVAKNDIKDPIVHDKDIDYLVFHSEDRETYNILQHYDDVDTFLGKCKQKKMKVFVHCVQGANRSVALVVAYLIRTTKRDVKDIVKDVSNVRPGILYNYSFCEKLLKFK